MAGMPTDRRDGVCTNLELEWILFYLTSTFTLTFVKIG